MVKSRRMGPAWLGIGAQRAGTTWFTDLLLQHPKVTLSKRERKELHILERPNVDVKAYRRLFGRYAGEWTPYYMRALNIPPIAAEALDDDAVVLVLLRDPVDRYASAMRHYESRRRLRKVTPELRRLIGSDVTWGGMYAAQLEAWAESIGTERMLVMQYEALTADPQKHADLVWQRLGLDPVPLQQAGKKSRTTSKKASWEWPEGLQERLARAFSPDVRRLAPWGVDLSLWPRFAHLADEAESNGVSVQLPAKPPEKPGSGRRKRWLAGRRR